MRLGANSTSGTVGLGDDAITFVVDYLDQNKVAFDPADARASAVVECDNHEALFHRRRNVTGPVTAFPVTTQ